jgi:hypothetical protein
MRKKFLPLLVAIMVFLVPFGSGSAATNPGLLRDKTMNYGAYVGGESIFSTLGTTTSITDNDLSTGYAYTYVNPGRYVWFNFDVPMDITNYIVNSNNSRTIKFFDHRGRELFSNNTSEIRNHIIETSNVKQVSYVSFSYSTTQTLYDFEVYGSPSENPNTNDILYGRNITIYKEDGTVAVAEGGSTSGSAFDGTISSAISIGNKMYFNMNLNGTYDLTNIYISVLTRPERIHINYYSGDNQTDLITTQTVSNLIQKSYHPMNITGVRSIKVYSSDANGNNLNELEFKGFKVPINYKNVSDLIHIKNYDSVSFSWKNPGIEEFNGVKVYRNGTLIKTIDESETTFKDSNVSPSTSYSYQLKSTYSDGYETSGLMVNVTTDDLENVSNLLYTKDYKSINFTWENPTIEEFTGVKVFRDGTLIDTLDKSITTLNQEGLSPIKEYSYKFISIYSTGFESKPTTITVKTDELPVVKDVKEVSVKATYNRVNIDWTLPTQEGLKHVNIYRKKIEKEPGFFESIFSLSGTKVYAADPETKIFETNGTYFNDLTVKPESEYQYTLTTQTDDGRESKGVIVKAITGEEPEPVLKDDGFSVDTDGNYVFKWTEPTTGKVKVLIDGSHYKTVEASNNQIIIPKSDLKFNSFGDPKVSLIPVSPNGKEGDRTNLDNNFLENIKLPFEVTDLLKTIMGILGLVAPIILLTLVIYYFKPIKNLIVRVAHQVKKGEVKHE